ncbi:glutathione S-transferase [Methylobacterium gossipiicola]|uniref:Glutathione S-transferase n=1 Tax=Methylobacterium gossipiicola TaxID=582675 RepID=A0A1I2SIQ7_9HYPH|nr:glutathione S-transferase [Methylobacterium gossipiicola]SFG49821.1 Glutathione S-transferase [Methylobacterium gossipiicola]
MKLFHSPFSPFVRKVTVVADELGLAERIELLPSAAHPTQRDATIRALHPLAQVPTLITDEGIALADSRVICEYLDALGGGGVFPPSGSARWIALGDQSTADGLLDAALLLRYELTVRTEGERSAAWIAGQTAKIEGVLDSFEAGVGTLANRVDIGTITVACALGYLDVRFPDLAWRRRAPALGAWADGFAERPSLRATKPPAA